MTAESRVRGVLPLKNERLAEFAMYVVGLFCTLVATYVLLDLKSATWTIPFNYSGDASFTAVAVRTMLERGWWTAANPMLGAPGAMSLADYPGADALHYMAMRIIALFTRSVPAIINIYYVATFPLTAAFTMFTLRRLGSSRLMAVVGALMYTLLPYHFFRGEGHLFLAGYYLLPLALLVVTRSFDTGRPILFGGTRDATPRILLSAPFAVSVCLLIGSSGIYYAFFTCFFLVVAGVWSCFEARSRRHALSAAVLILLVTLSVAVNFVPSLVYWSQNGRNASAVERGPIGAEVYGLKIDQLLLPVSGHRVGVLAAIKSAYEAAESSIVIDSSPQTPTLGLAGSLAFVFLLAWLLFGRFRALSFGQELDQRLDWLSALTGAGVLLATTGGFGAIVAFVLPQIRGYERISVYLALFATTALVLVADSVGEYVRQRIGNAAAVGVAVVLAVLILLDMTTPSVAPNYADTRMEFRSDASFVSRIGDALPPQASVFELPYTPFPESPPVNKMADYEHFRGYLHSTDLRWSYGAVKGRQDDAWQREVSSLAAPAMFSKLKARGFGGVWVNRDGYADRGAEIERSLAADTASPPLISEDGSLAFFVLK